MTQFEAIEFLREFSKDKTRYRVAKIVGVTWATMDNWLGKKPKEISYNNLEKIEKLKNGS